MLFRDLAAARAEAFVAEGLLVPAGTVRNGRPEYRVSADVVVPVRARGSGLFVIVLKDYISDGYSLPSVLLQFFQPKNPRWLLPSLVHDWLYDTGMVDRGVADRILLEQMRAAGVAKWQRLIVFVGVRIGGGGGFNKPLPKNLAVVNRAASECFHHCLTACLKERSPAL
jgi:hypothetical protein